MTIRLYIIVVFSSPEMYNAIDRTSYIFTTKHWKLSNTLFSCGNSKIKKKNEFRFLINAQ